MSQISVNDISSLDGKSGPVISGITTVSSTGYMMVPAGPTEYRGGRGRGVISEGRIGTGLDYITISTLGNSSDFGRTTLSTQTEGFALASSTRGLFAGGYSTTPTYSNSIEYITIQSTGNAFDFGDLTAQRRSGASASSNTRGIFYGGIDTGIDSSRIIDYVTIASLGNSSNFGEASDGLGSDQAGGCSSSTRAIFMGGYLNRQGAFGGAKNIISYLTISTLGNSKDFGDLTKAYSNTSCCSDSTRGILMGGYETPTKSNSIEYITIASTGDAIDFGDLTQNRGYLASVSNSIRGVACGGNASPVTTNSNVMDYVTIQSLGNAQNFGDLTTASRVVMGCSDAHGGLG